VDPDFLLGARRRDRHSLGRRPRPSAAKIEQIDTEQRFAENAARIAQGTTAGAGEAAGKFVASDGSRRGAQALGRNLAADVNKGLGTNLKEITMQGSEKIQTATLLPAWYVRNWMYTAVFVISLCLLGATFWIMATDDQIDANYDGVPDSQQPPRTMAMSPTPAETHARGNG
jgi:hypothetical protein